MKLRTLVIVLLIYLLTVLGFACLCKTSCGAPPEWCVEVEVKERGAVAFGSGTLVTPTHVITNWHVVKSRTSQDIKVNFPNGTNRIGKVIKQDRNWDVAVIKLPIGKVKPAPLGYVPPNGFKVTIRGYGPGRYRAATGRLSPVLPTPNVTGLRDKPGLRYIDGAVARLGDSGGPVTFNNHFIGTIIGADGNTLFVDINRINTIFELRK